MSLAFPISLSSVTQALGRRSPTACPWEEQPSRSCFIKGTNSREGLEFFIVLLKTSSCHFTESWPALKCPQNSTSGESRLVSNVDERAEKKDSRSCIKGCFPSERPQIAMKALVPALFGESDGFSYQQHRGRSRTYPSMIPGPGETVQTDDAIRLKLHTMIATSTIARLT